MRPPDGLAVDSHAYLRLCERPSKEEIEQCLRDDDRAIP
jgi:hypothetical protein